MRKTGSFCTMGVVTSTSGLHRALPVPDGLEGQRVDQALSRLFGLTRTAAPPARSTTSGTLRRRAIRTTP